MRRRGCSPLVHVSATDRPRLVHLASIDGVIDLGLAAYLQRVLDEAEETGAAAAIPEINALGGRVDATARIGDALLRAPVPTMAYGNKRAISAKALIGLAADKRCPAASGARRKPWWLR